jgi:hypothetical protein
LATSGIADALGLGGFWLAPGESGICAALVVALAGLTWRQTYVCHDVETLWRKTLDGNPMAWMPDYNLDKALSDWGRTEEAIVE